MKFQLQLPVQGFISQNFGGNATTLYANAGLKGHPGTDIVSKYDDPILDSIIGFNKKYVYSLLNKDNPDLMRYRAVCFIVEADNGVFEVICGHCNDITCQIGPTTVGEKLATEGNTGDVFVGGAEVTAAAKEAGTHAGAHVHFQVRRLKKITSTTLHSITVDGIHDYVDADGFHFDTPNYNNGYNGCIDLMQFVGVQDNYKFNSNLGVGSWGRDVLELQKRLVKLGFTSLTPIGIFGLQTRQAVIEYQLANGIDPTGYCAVLTRASLNS